MMPDKDKVMKGLSCCIVSMAEEEPFAKCEKCPYGTISIDVQTCRSILSAEALELLKEREEIVRCKDCAMSHPWNDDVVQCRNKKISSTYVQKDWFCADGVKAE